MKSSLESSDGRAASRRLRCWLNLTGAISLALTTAGCSLLKSETTNARSLVQSIFGTKSDAETAQKISLLQTIVMREADRYVAMMAEVTDAFSTRVDTREARFAAQQWKLNQATAVYINATGENPIFNAVDMAILATVSRMVLEDYWVGEKFGATAQPLLEIQHQLETNAWAVVDDVLTPQQRQELHAMIVAWRARNPHQRNVGAARFSNFVKFLSPYAATEHAAGPAASLFSLAMVNPRAGLDPAVQAIEQTRP